MECKDECITVWVHPGAGVVKPSALFCDQGGFLFCEIPDFLLGEVRFVGSCCKQCRIGRDVSFVKGIGENGVHTVICLLHRRVRQPLVLDFAEHVPDVFRGDFGDLKSSYSGNHLLEP